MEQKFSDLNFKEKAAIVSACAAFVLGWALSIAGFCLPPIGAVSDSVLWILGQALIYAASVFGVTSYFSAEAVQMKKEVQDFLVERERLANERLKLKQNIDEGEMPT